MHITDLLLTTFVPPQIADSVEEALAKIDGYKLTHVPVFEGLTFLGNAPEQLLEKFDLEVDLFEVRKHLDYFFLTENSTVFDAVNVFYTHECNMIPVLNNEEKYLGFIVVEDVLAVLSRLPLLSDPSALMTVKVAQRQFSMSEIANIVEAENGRLIGAFISGYEEDMVKVTLRLQAENLTSISEAFERFGYLISYKLFHDERQDLIKDRYDLLMKYLDF